jgi:hypothetical protein
MRFLFSGGCSSVTSTTDATFSNPSVISSSGCTKFSGFVTRDGTTTDLGTGVQGHGTYIAGIIAGSAPVYYNNNTEAKWWEGIAPSSKLFFMKIFSNMIAPTIYIPPSLQAGFLQWVTNLFCLKVYDLCSALHE